MSVTFSLASSVLVDERFVIECSCGQAKSEVFADYKTAMNAYPRDTPICGDDYCFNDDRGWVTPVEQSGDELMINVSNINARMILETLGIKDEELYGDALGEDFLGRVLTALAIAPQDEGVPSHESPTVGARFIDCGRAPDYLQDRLEQLRLLADRSISTGRQIQWS